MGSLLDRATKIAQNLTLPCTVHFCLGLTRQAAQIPEGLILDNPNAPRCLIILLLYLFGTVKRSSLARFITELIDPEVSKSSHKSSLNPVYALHLSLFH